MKKRKWFCLLAILLITGISACSSQAVPTPDVEEHAQATRLALTAQAQSVSASATANALAARTSQPADTTLPASTSTRVPPTHTPTKEVQIATQADVPDGEPVDISGTTITVLGNISAGQVKRSFELFEGATGANVFYVQGDWQAEIWDYLDRGELPDVVILPQPGVARQLADEGYIIDLKAFMSEEFLNANYLSDWLEMGTYKDRLIGVFFTTSVKSLVWYPVNAFHQAGYQVPETWEDLIALSDRIVADGKTPWCIGVKDGHWVITDWLEDIMLRVNGKDDYDRWIDGDLAFNSPEVARAAQIMGEIFFTEGYVLGGRAGLIDTSWWDSARGILSDPPECYLHRQASFVKTAFPPEVVLGRDVDFFYLPPMVENTEPFKPLLIGGDMASMLQDRPEVRLFMEYLATVESVRPMINQGGAVSPHIGPALDWYPTYSDREYAQMLMDADVIRFDGSDMMPNHVGNRAFWDGMYAYVNGADLEIVLQEIDASWSR